MRTLLLLLALLLCACPPSRGDDDDSACVTALQVCATYSGSPEDGSATIRTGPEDELPVQSPLDDAGCATFQVDAGTWEWRAEDSSMTCISVYEAVEVTACETAEVSVELVNWCMDG
ncbi:MAG: hypothetical protein KDA24_04985 [Deltaproteobacteria bacterium]|nr:hypothetical protein [Deltaproteobacteria bacterium]